VIETVSSEPHRQFIVEARDFGVRPGIDLDTIGRLADELEDEAVAAPPRRRKPA